MRLSPIRGERDLQIEVLALMGWLVAGVVAVAAAGPATPVRAALGAVFALIALRLPLLLRRHAGELRTVAGLKRQYATLGVILVVLSPATFPFFSWPALAAAVVGAACAVAAARVRTAEPTRRIDYEDPAAWDDAATRLLGRSPGRLWAVIAGAGVALFAVIVAGAALLAG